MESTELDNITLEITFLDVEPICWTYFASLDDIKVGSPNFLSSDSGNIMFPL